jgi:hypothetical protein
MDWEYVAKDNMYYPELIKRQKERHVAKVRKCLKCGKPLESAWAGERLHRNCRESNSYISDLET